MIEDLKSVFQSHVKLYVQNDAVAALASGTMGKLHGCVLIASTRSISYGFTEDVREARAAGGGPVLGDWGRLDQFYFSTLCMQDLSICYNSSFAVSVRISDYE
ncbi:N-acetyl-D-glucosamine kinase [Heracleum sosnowskyi]|uniref:N-acetylglucosamine kinase n=1 Tax=Heracleum sosnowskyi TaxID=360622 RepID=A0AAD8MJR2_9APIA|nr:N-acetyl-D-glucosamine kinase [Heracleum sosnowskyi]